MAAEGWTTLNSRFATAILAMAAGVTSSAWAQTATPAGAQTTMQTGTQTSVQGGAQTGVQTGVQTSAQPPAAVQTTTRKPLQTAPLRLQTLGSDTQADPFPPVDPKNFTADSPTAAMVDKYLHAVLGYDPARIWRVEAIQKTAATGVSRVTAAISERGPNSKVLNATFYVLPDGKHLIADGTGVAAFGDNPYAENYALLKSRADGPAHGGTSTALMLVEFADLQCPHCKDAQAVMAKLATDFPKARIVYQSFPIASIHPFAFEAATYGACVAKTSSEAFFTYNQAVYDMQGALTAEAGQQTLNNAVTKAGGDPAKVAACAATDAIKAHVNASEELGVLLGVNQTPMLAVNGRLLPLTSVPYETLKEVIAFQAQLDGVSGVAGVPAGR